jgi:selenocysteine-specific elongation factor
VDQAPRHLILGTAGHIDHGKTSLVRALTGTDTDRLPEEKRRGMTIELGFAALQLDDVTFGIVDVPGHEKFVRTMVAGATGIDVALIVVAADDSVMPQTVEHVVILDLLGVDAAVVAITKCDLVDDDMAELAAAETSELLARTRLKVAPVVRVSSTTGRGLDALRSQLQSVAKRVARRHTNRPFRMCIDRVFTVAGRGTVVTGSVISGQLTAGESVELLPGGHTARAREVQTHHRDAALVRTGERAAVNLQGIDFAAVARGCELAAPGMLTPTRWLDADLRCLASHPQPIRNHSRLRLCIGTREVLVRCVLLDKPQLGPGESDLVQLRAREELIATCGQRFIVRDENAARTAGGGMVLRAARRRISPRMTDDVNGLRQLQGDTPADRVAETIRYHGFHNIDNAALALAANVSRDELPTTIRELEKADQFARLPGVDHPISRAHLDAFTRRSLAWLAARHQRQPDEPGTLLDAFTGYLERRSTRPVARALLQRMCDDGAVRVLGRYVCLPQFAPTLSAEDERVLAGMLDACSEAAFQPPTLDELARHTGASRQRVDKLTRIAVSLNQLVRLETDIVLHAERAAELRRRVRALYAADGPFTVSQMRAALDTTRKYAVPFAEYLDRIGFTRRQGDQRVVAMENQNDLENA